MDFLDNYEVYAILQAVYSFCQDEVGYKHFLTQTAVGSINDENDLGESGDKEMIDGESTENNLTNSKKRRFFVRQFYKNNENQKNWMDKLENICFVKYEAFDLENIQLYLKI